MPKRLTSDFPFPADVFAGPFVNALPSSEQVAIVKLWTWAWLNDCRVPLADAQAMGQITALGDGWPSSSLAAAAGRHFAADGLALALSDSFHARAEWRRKSAEGGRRSGLARRAKGGSRVVPPSPPPTRTTLQPPFNHPSTTVPQIDATPVREPECAEMAPPKPVPAETTADFPPIPPLRETSFKEPISQGGGGGKGEGGYALGPDPTPTEIAAMVEQVCRVYAESVQPGEPVNQRARSNIQSLLKRGTDVGVLIDASRHYGEFCDKEQREPRYRKAAHNFFSRKEAIWRQHITPRVLGGVTGLACFAERLKVLCPAAAEWFFVWGEQHAARNDFSKADDPNRLATWWATFHGMQVTSAEAESASLWMTTKPKVTNRVANRDTIVARIRHARMTPATKVVAADVDPVTGQPCGPPIMGWDYMNSDFRKKLKPEEYNADGALTDAALEKHGYERDGSKADKKAPLERSPFQKGTVR